MTKGRIATVVAVTGALAWAAATAAVRVGDPQARALAYRVATMAVIRHGCMRQMGLAEGDHTLESCACTAEVYGRVALEPRGLEPGERALLAAAAMLPDADRRALSQWLTDRAAFHATREAAVSACRGEASPVGCLDGLRRELGALAPEHAGDNPAFLAVLDRVGRLP
ncbi:MAG: hypothetical protein AB1918_05645 [Pseudomonadota bacterium]